MLHKRSIKPSFLSCTTRCWQLYPIPQHQHNTNCKLGKRTGWWSLIQTNEKSSESLTEGKRKLSPITPYMNIVKGAKYLGVTIDRTLSWNEHVNNVTKKANNSRAFLQRNINKCPEAIKRLSYAPSIITQLSYAIPVRHVSESIACVPTNTIQPYLDFYSPGCSTVCGHIGPRLFNRIRTYRAQTVQPHPDT